MLPYSTASIERNFSTLGDVKTIKRNRLQIESLEACLLCKEDILHHNFRFNSEMIENYNKSHLVAQENLSHIPQTYVSSEEQKVTSNLNFSDQRREPSSNRMEEEKINDSHISRQPLSLTLEETKSLSIFLNVFS